LAVIHYCYLAILKPGRLVVLEERLWRSPSLGNVYFILIAGGWFAIFYNGLIKMLFWIPASWGIHAEDERFISIKHYVTILISILSIAVLFQVNEAAKKSPKSAR
jgi:hypothetical protein